MTNPPVNEKSCTSKIVQLPTKNSPTYCLWHIKKNTGRFLAKSKNWNEIKNKADAIFSYDHTAWLIINEESDLLVFHLEIDVDEQTGVYSIVNQHDCPIRYELDELHVGLTFEFPNSDFKN